MQKFSLEAVARQQLEAAHRSPAARAATTVFGGHDRTLRQTVIGLGAGTSLGEHDSPGEGTLYVLSGRVTLTAGAESWDARSGDLLVIPQAQHALHAHEDSAVLLTAVPANRAG